MEELINYIKRSKHFTLNYIEQNFLNQEVQATLDKYEFSLYELCYRLRKGIPLDKLFSCRVCGNKVKFRGKRGYSTFCSIKCKNKYINNLPEVKLKTKQTCINKYGVDHPNKLPEFREKIRQTSLKKYGTNHPSQKQEVKDKYKQTSLKKYGVDNYSKTQECNKKRKETFLKNYGTDHPAKTQSFHDKIKQTSLKKYGTDYYAKTQESKDRIKQTCIEKYGVESPFQLQEFKDKYKQTCINKYGIDHFMKLNEYLDKVKQTCIDKYGTDNYNKSEEYINRLEEIQNKIYTTKKKNGTFNTSEQEEECYQLLLTKFSKEDIIRQYRSKEYPYACDFYIKSLNLYIEYNGSWTHGPEPFNKDNPEHIKLLNFYKTKSEEKNFKGRKKKYFNSAIYTWTDLDVRKLKTFKKNKLNYKIFWNIEEVKKFIEGE